MKLNILYEDNDIVAINKPAGLVVHYDGKTKEDSVSSWVAENYPEVSDVGEPIILSNGQKIIRPGIVHRIDRETSGVLLVAKNKEAFFFLKKQFQEHKISKTYHAFVYGKIDLPKKETAIINRPIGRSKNDFRKWTAERGARGEMRESVTEYKVLNFCDQYSFVEVYPKTGRTHQIRVHFKAINHPVVCDRLYAPKRESILGFERLALHASSIQFETILGGKKTIEAPFPKDFVEAMKFL